MAGENGNQAEAVALFEAIERNPYHFGFYQVVRRINCANPDKALVGTAYRPGDDPVRFCQTPHTHFAPSTLYSLEFDGAGKAPRLYQMLGRAGSPSNRISDKHNNPDLVRIGRQPPP